jgi:hypothetical protein
MADEKHLADGVHIHRINLCEHLKNNLPGYGFTKIGQFVPHRRTLPDGFVCTTKLEFFPDAPQMVGKRGCIYAFVSADGAVGKIGKTGTGWSRINYRHLNRGYLSRPKEQEGQRRAWTFYRPESSVWFKHCTFPELDEVLFTFLLQPVEQHTQFRHGPTGEYYNDVFEVVSCAPYNFTIVPRSGFRWTNGSLEPRNATDMSQLMQLIEQAEKCSGRFTR